jgi:hypothetical protein
MTDTLDFVKSLWGNMNVPGVTGPSLSTDELDKRISDLKAVEAWLTMNMTMLRGTIQAMEVQRGTIATLKAMSASMAEAMGQAGGGGTAAGAMPFQNFFTPPGATPGGKPAAPPPGAAPAAAAQQAQPGAGGPESTAPPGAEALPAAMAWWNLLQDQFKQAVASTMSPEAIASATAMAQDTAARFSAAAQPAPPPAADTGNASAQPGVANPKPRNGKPKADKS